MWTNSGRYGRTEEDAEAGVEVQQVWTKEDVNTLRPLPKWNDTRTVAEEGRVENVICI